MKLIKGRAALIRCYKATGNIKKHINTVWKRTGAEEFSEIKHHSINMWAQLTEIKFHMN